MPNKDIKVPNIGEFKDVEVIEVLVSIGQLVNKNDPLITIESDKSSVEIPSLYQGEVKTTSTLPSQCDATTTSISPSQGEANTASMLPSRGEGNATHILTSRGEA